ncbi:MAG: GntR family transcriptional regulator, partial [Firmicutes bacterium]|nr:GntR family transcriptional regulator [Bacillota bacterium]
DELPSRRVLSARLGINPNTVQKAFALLEEAGLIESRAGSGSVMTLSAEKLGQLKAELLEEEVLGMVRVLKQTGLDADGAADLIRKYWEEA